MTSGRQSSEVADWWCGAGAQELREMLNEWDPIGLKGFGHDPGDEYDTYRGWIFATLAEGGRETEVWRTLDRALGYMALGSAREREEVLAMRIVRWWRESSPDRAGA